MLRVGLEPTHPKISDFKSLAATYYAIGAVKLSDIFLLCSSLFGFPLLPAPALVGLPILLICSLAASTPIFQLIYPTD